MDVVAWIATGLLAVVLLPAGIMKLSQPPQALIDKGLKWVADMPVGLVRGVGVIEVLAVIGLIVPPLVDVAAWLAVAAAAGVIALMVGAAVVHIRRREYALVAMNVVVAALAAVVIVARSA